MSAGDTSIFFGRRGELEALGALLKGARNGRSGSLVIRAGAGMGKTYLLRHALAEHADEMRVLYISGAEAEMVLDYAALQRLCAALRTHLDMRVDQLPKLQGHALRVATGTESGESPDPYLVGLAAVNLFSEAGAEQPLVCVVDVAQWIDDVSRRVLGFVARRLQADRVALVFATRDTTPHHLDGLTQLQLQPLSGNDSRALLDAVLPGRLEHLVRERLLREAAGNPLALVEMPRSLSIERAGGRESSSHGSAARTVEDAFATRFQALPEPTRLLLLIAAAEPTGESSWLWSAAERLGVGVADAAPAEAAGLIALDTRISFRHPLVRSAVYRTEPTMKRHRVHAALAETITGAAAADYRSWHRAHATSAPDEAVAADLTNAAQRARDRGGNAPTATFLAYAVELTPDPAQRARRALVAAGAKLDAGDITAAASLLESADAVTVDARHHAQVALLRARLAFAGARGHDGPGLLLAAARALAEHEPALSRDTYLEALMAAMIVGRLASNESYEPVWMAAEVRRYAPPPTVPPRTVDLLLDALVVRFQEGFATAAPLLRAALHAYLRDVHGGIADARWHDVTNRICLDLCDFTSWSLLGLHQLNMLRAAGELTVLPSALITYAAVSLFDGDFVRTQTLLDEGSIVSSATGAPPHRSGIALLAAYRGQDELWCTTAEQTMADATTRGEGTEVAVVLYADAVANAGATRYVEALESCSKGMKFADLGLYSCFLLEMVEAAAYLGDFVAARDAAAELADRATPDGGESALGLAARALALAKGPEATDGDYSRAITHLERSPLAVYRARTQLVYGEWLRRNGRDGDARTQLRLAHDAFTRMGAGGFAARASRELNAAGAPPTPPTHRYDAGLTAQERHIALLIQQGQSNAEVAAQLLISHRTVEWHLRNIYAKLGIASRRQLRDLAP